MFKQKKPSYSDRFKKDMGDLIDQLDLTEFQKRSMKARWLDQLNWLSGKAKHSQKWYHRLRLTTIVGGVLIPAMVSLNITDNKTREYAIWFTFGVSQLVAVSAAIDEFFHYGDLRIQYRKTAETLKSEGWQFFQLTGPYRKAGNHKQAYIEFSNRVESIIQNDVQGYTELLKQKAEEDKQKAATKQQGGTAPTPTAYVPPALAPSAPAETPAFASAPKTWDEPAPASLEGDLGMPPRVAPRRMTDEAAPRSRPPGRSFAEPGPDIAQEELAAPPSRGGGLRAPGRSMNNVFSESGEEDLAMMPDRDEWQVAGGPMVDGMPEAVEEDLQISLDTSGIAPPGRPTVGEGGPGRGMERSRGSYGRMPGSPPDVPVATTDRYRDRSRTNS